MPGIRQSLLVIIISFLLAPLYTNALTFTLSDDAIMALDYKYNTCGQSNATITNSEYNNQGIRFDITFSDPLGINGNPDLSLISWRWPSNGFLVGRDISMFDSFALKFTLLSEEGIPSDT